MNSKFDNTIAVLGLASFSVAVLSLLVSLILFIIFGAEPFIGPVLKTTGVSTVLFVFFAFITFMKEEYAKDHF